MHADYTENKWFSMCTEFSTEVGITAWPHHWMFTAVTVLVPSACALASCMEQHFTSGMYSTSDLWSFPRPFIRRVYSYISLPVKSKAAICDGVGWLVGWLETNQFTCPKYILKMHNPPNLQSNNSTMQMKPATLYWNSWRIYYMPRAYHSQLVFWERAESWFSQPEVLLYYSVNK